MTEQQKEILIVEDDFELCSLLAQAVIDISGNYEVKTAGNVDEAMVQVRRFQTLQKAFDLVITDVKMAGLSGLELLEVLHSIAPQTKTVVMTAYNSAELAERAQELNVYAYLTKPFVISEFRHIVQSAISPLPAPTAAEASTARPALSGAQMRAVLQQLSSLRTMTGANATILIDNTGKLVISDTLETTGNLDGLSEALLTAQRLVEQQINASINAPVRVNQSYFGADTFNICTYRIQDDRFLGTIFGPAVREGQVWYYMKEAGPKIEEAMHAVESPVAETPRRNLKDEYLAMVDQYFTGDARRRRRGQQAPLEQPAPPPPLERGPSRSEPAGPTSEKPSSVHMPVIEPMLPDPLADVEIQEADLEAIKDIDWSIGEAMDWDNLVAETDQGFLGMTLAEAQQQGVDLGEVVPVQNGAAGQAENPENEAALDEIDWNQNVTMDWDSLVSETDKGLNGISMDEAKEKGLIDDLG